MSALQGVQVLLFDVFGTVVDWRSSITKTLEDLGKQYSLEVSVEEWQGFADEWRTGYYENINRIAQGGSGSNNVDVLHREILEKILSSSKWSHVGKVLNEEARVNLNLAWHRLNGWPDAVPGLYELKKNVIIAALSNGNVRLLVDMAKHADLPWDVVFSSSLFNSYKPNPVAYQGALANMSLAETPHKAAMVAAHVWDLRGAAKVGLKTVYVRRPQEDRGAEAMEVKSKAEGGEFDVVVQDFQELARLFQ
ncbi:haloacid dehalogenase [Gymnopus androsaceus JB14]|uniref:Haloacid dehalogenase n=1 Tax=Gymnopus androsaceus JB14 TaxID=1447944 RepID=A0A6A4H5L5_9AGAR|nr:haloacid dehalogenase [Gymnopus androsaceus JB14]